MGDIESGRVKIKRSDNVKIKQTSIIVEFNNEEFRTIGKLLGKSAINLLKDIGMTSSEANVLENIFSVTSKISLVDLDENEKDGGIL